MSRNFIIGENAGIVDENVDISEFCVEAGKTFFDRRFVANIHRQGRGAEFRCELRDPVRQNVDEDQSTIHRGEPPADSLADHPGRAGHQTHLARK